MAIYEHNKADVGNSAANITIRVKSASIGDVVYVKNGVYRENLPLVVPAGVTVQGESLRGTEVRPATSTGSQIKTVSITTKVGDGAFNRDPKKEDCFDHSEYKTFDAKVACVKNKKDPPKDPKAYVASVLRDKGEIEEMSAMGAGAVAGPGAAQKKKKSLIREEDPTIDEIMNYLLNDLGVVANAN